MMPGLKTKWKTEMDPHRVSSVWWVVSPEKSIREPRLLMLWLGHLLPDNFLMIALEVPYLATNLFRFLY